MPGTWVSGDVTQADQRPGLYANFNAQAAASIRGGLSGIVAATVRAAWGPSGTVTKIENIGDLTTLFTKNETSFPVNNAFFIGKNLLLGGAKTLLLYRLVGPAAAKGKHNIVDTTGSPVNTIDLDGKYDGLRANSFTITVAAAPTDSSRKLITLIESGVTLTTWTTRLDNAAAGMMQNLVDQINDDTANSWITATFNAAGNETLANIAATALTGGVDDNGNVVAADYVEATDAFENEDFSIACFDTINSAILATTAAWVTTVRGNGKKIILVTGSDTADAVAAAKTDAEGFNQEGMVYVHPGYLADNEAGVETTYPGYLAAFRVAGIITGQTFRESPTFEPILQIANLVNRLGTTDIKSLITSGVLPLVYDGRQFKIERGVTTLSIPSAIQSDDNKKIKVVRILDNINNALVNAVSDQIVGKVSNDASGRSGVVGLISGFLSTLALDGAIEFTFTVEEDPDNPPVNDRFFIKIGVTPIDAIEFVYLTIEIS
jgi:hypothetical protein